MNANHTNIVANWKATYVASVTLTGAAGTVTSTSTPSQATQFNCTTGTCQVTFDADMVVSVTAAPSGQNAFFSWTGPCASQTNELCVLDSTHKTATVAFAAPADLATWTFTGVINTDTPWPVTSTAGNVSGGSLSKRASQTNAGGTNAFCAYGWGSPASASGPDLSLYYEFSVSAAGGHSILYRTVETTVSGVSGETGTSKWAIRSDVDSYTADLSSGQHSITGGNKFALNMDVAALGKRSGTVTFRLYFYGFPNSGYLRCLVGSASGGNDLRTRGIVF